MSARGQRAGTALAVLALAATAMLEAPLSALEVSYLAPVGGQTALEALVAITDLSGIPQALDPALVLSDGQRHLCVELRHASLASERQALACALGCWWVRPSGPRETVVYTRAGVLAEGAIDARWTTSSLVDRPELLPVVRSLLAPWIGAGAGIAYERDSGSWPATLDRPGQARLVQLLGLLEHPHASCPDALPDPEQPDLRRDLASAVAAGSWEELARGLSAASGLSVALGPGLVLSGSCPDLLPAGTIGNALRTLTTRGIHAEVRHGVICLDAAPIGDCQHPATARELALIPIGHLARTAADGERIASAVRAAVTPSAWSLPGWGLYAIPRERALVASADPEHLHGVLDALATIDQLGLDDGLRALAAASGPAPSAHP